MDSLTEALVTCVKACGGSKQVACVLWPEKAPDAAQRLLLDCLNDDRAAHLSPDHVMLVLKLARAKGCHAGFYYMADVLGYSQPTPIDPRDEVAELQRQFVAATQSMAAMVQRMEQLQPAVQVTGFPNLRAA